MSANEIRRFDQCHGSTVAFAFDLRPLKYRSAERQSKSEKDMNRDSMSSAHFYFILCASNWKCAFSIFFFFLFAFCSGLRFSMTQNRQLKRNAARPFALLYNALDRGPLPIYQCIGVTFAKIHLSVLFCGPHLFYTRKLFGSRNFMGQKKKKKKNSTCRLNCIGAYCVSVPLRRCGPVKLQRTILSWPNINAIRLLFFYEER